MKAVQATSLNSLNILQFPALEAPVNHYKLDKHDLLLKFIPSKKFVQSYNPSSISELTDILCPLKAAFPV